MSGYIPNTALPSLPSWIVGASSAIPLTDFNSASYTLFANALFSCKVEIAGFSSFEPTSLSLAVLTTSLPLKSLQTIHFKQYVLEWMTYAWAMFFCVVVFSISAALFADQIAIFCVTNVIDVICNFREELFTLGLGAAFYNSLKCPSTQCYWGDPIFGSLGRAGSTARRSQQCDCYPSLIYDLSITTSAFWSNCPRVTDLLFEIIWGQGWHGLRAFE